MPKELKIDAFSLKRNTAFLLKYTAKENKPRGDNDAAKDMLLVDNVDDREFLQELFFAIEPELPLSSKKR